MASDFFPTFSSPFMVLGTMCRNLELKTFSLVIQVSVVLKAPWSLVDGASLLSQFRDWRGSHSAVVRALLQELALGLTSGPTACRQGLFCTSASS